MDIVSLIRDVGALWSPPLFAVLVAVSALLIWLAIIPSRAMRSVDERLETHVETQDPVQRLELRQSFAKRVLLPMVRRALYWLGRRMPLASIENTRRRWERAGEPWGLTALDFLGLALLLPFAMGGAYVLLMRDRLPLTLTLRNALAPLAAGFLLPHLWLHQRVRRRQREIDRALPDALDMLSIGVEAGLGFESAMLGVADQWNNALTQEFQWTVREMRLGMPRDRALRRMASRTGVESLATFVAVLVQSTRLGVSISEVLHTQAAQMRLRRRQMAEEAAREASIKMIFPLVFMIFPAVLVVLLGPSAPQLVDFFANLAGGSFRLR